MIDCVAVEDRMPAVAHGADNWSAEEADHLAACHDCALEWRLVQAGASLHQDAFVDADRIASRVLERLRSEPIEVRPIRRLPWRGPLIGLLAAAASVALVVWAPRGGQAGNNSRGDTAMLAIAPELQSLDDQQLESVLQGLEPVLSDGVMPNDGTHLDDLTDAQLEQLLHSMGGQ